MVERPGNVVFAALAPRHLERLLSDPLAEAAFGAFGRSPADAAALCRGLAYVALRAHHAGWTPIAASGIVEYWPGRGGAWFVPGRIRRREWPAVTRRVEAGIREAHRRGLARLEIVVQAGHADGHAWARRLGFGDPVFLPCYLPDGADAWMYVHLHAAAPAAAAAE